MVYNLYVYVYASFNHLYRQSQCSKHGTANVWELNWLELSTWIPMLVPLRSRHFMSKNFDTFTRTPARESKMNDVVRAHLTFQMFTLLQKYHYNDVLMSTMASQITGISIVQPFVQAQIKENIKPPRHWLFEWIHRWPVDSPHKGWVMVKIFTFDEVIMMINYCMEHYSISLHCT